MASGKPRIYGVAHAASATLAFAGDINNTIAIPTQQGSPVSDRSPQELEKLVRWYRDSDKRLIYLIVQGTAEYMRPYMGLTEPDVMFFWLERMRLDGDVPLLSHTVVRM